MFFEYQKSEGSADTQNETLNQFLVQSIEPDTAQVTILSYDTVLTELSQSLTTNSGSQPTENLQKVSAASTGYYPQSGPYAIQIRRQITPGRALPESPTLSNRGHTITINQKICRKPL